MDRQTLDPYIHLSLLTSSRDLRAGAAQNEIENEKMIDGRYRVMEGEGLYNLTIQNLTPKDSGLYYCIADFVSSPVRKTFVLLVVIGKFLIRLTAQLYRHYSL